MPESGSLSRACSHLLAYLATIAVLLRRRRDDAAWERAWGPVALGLALFGTHVVFPWYPSWSLALAFVGPERSRLAWGVIAAAVGLVTATFYVAG